MAIISDAVWRREQAPAEQSGGEPPHSRLGLLDTKSPSTKPRLGWWRGFAVPIVSFKSGEDEPYPGLAYWMKASWLTGCCLKGIGSLLPAGVTILEKTVPSIVLLMNRTEPSQKA